MEATIHGDRTILRKDGLTVEFTGEGAARRLRSVERRVFVPNFMQIQKVTFENYRDFSGASVPTKVISYFAGQNGESTRTYEVTDVRFGDVTRVPVVEQSFGVRRVLDYRVKPSMTYDADGALASLEQLEAWAADPQELERHNEGLNTPLFRR